LITKVGGKRGEKPCPLKKKGSTRKRIKTQKQREGGSRGFGKVGGWEKEIEQKEDEGREYKGENIKGKKHSNTHHKGIS